MNLYIPPIIEKVYNVSGSTAAPGSGEYHRYRAMRRRERTIAAAMEKEFQVRKVQQEFEDQKEVKSQILENERLKRKRRRDAKEEKLKIKKQFAKVIEDKKDIFRKDIPLIDQVKNEIGDELFKKMCYQDNANDDDFDYTKEKSIKNNKTNLKKGIKRNYLANLYNTETHYENKENDEKNDENLKKLFPTLQPKSFEFENYDDYEEHLQILEIIEKNEKKRIQKEKIEDAEAEGEAEEKNPFEEVKFMEVGENIVIHDEDF